MSAPEPQGSQKSRFSRQVAITVVMTVVLLALGEGVLRVWAYYFRHSYQQYDAGLGMIRLVPGYNRGVGSGRITVNAQGFRGREFAERKPSGVYRIFNLGDSVTFGLGGDDCPYSVKLERLLNQGRPSRTIEVINAGVEGYNSRDALRLLVQEVLKYQPDLVTILIGWNDLMKHDAGSPEPSETLARLAYVTYDIYLVKFWRKVVYAYLRPLTRSVRTDVAEADREAYKNYIPIVFEENVRHMIRLARERGVTVILLTRPSALQSEMSLEVVRKLQFPYYTYSLQKLLTVHRRYNEVIRRIGAQEGVLVLDMEAAFDGKGDLFFDTMHTSCAGNDVFAETLAAFLRGHRIGPEADARAEATR